MLRTCDPKIRLRCKLSQNLLQLMLAGKIPEVFPEQDLYPNIEEKAANLLYLMVTDHTLSIAHHDSSQADDPLEQHTHLKLREQ